MVQMLWLPRGLDLSEVRRISQDPVARSMLPLPTDGIVKIAICQEGRVDKQSVENEKQNFERMYHHYLRRPDITVQFYEFSFDDHWRGLAMLSEIHILYMTGFSPGQNMPTRLRQAFVELAASNGNEGDPAEPERRSIAEMMLSTIRNRVQYNRLVSYNQKSGDK